VSESVSIKDYEIILGNNDDFNPYEILGLEVNATNEEVCKAFKIKAKGMHPDRGGNPDKVNIFYAHKF